MIVIDDKSKTTESETISLIGISESLVWFFVMPECDVWFCVSKKPNPRVQHEIEKVLEG
jgi:hypothetical protein